MMIDEKTGEVFPTPPTWMIDGKPGQILSLMAKCAVEVGEVALTRKGRGDQEMSYRSAEAIKTAARVLGRNEVVIEWKTTEDNSPIKAFGEIRVTGRFIAPDGSYIVHSIKAAAFGGQGRHFTVAVTAGVKQILSLALQMATADGEERDEMPEPQEQNEASYSEDLESVLLQQKQAQTVAELNRTTASPCYALLSNAERVTADRIGTDVYNQLVRRLGMAQSVDPRGKRGH